MLHKQTNNLPGCVRDTKRFRNHVGMLLRKCLLCELWLKEAEEKSNRKKQRNTSTWLWQKTIYLNILLQKMFLITTENSPAIFIVASHGIPHAVEDSWPVDQQGHLPPFSLCFFLLLFSSASFNHNSKRRHFQRYIPVWFRVLFTSLTQLGSWFVC